MKRFFFLTAILLCAASSILAQDSPIYIQKADSASLFIEREDWPQAEKLLLEALRLEPANFNNALLLNNLARVMQQTGRDLEALENYNLALYMAPANTTIRYNRGLLLLSLDRIDEAIDDFTKAAENPAAGTQPILMRAFCFMRKSDPQAAEKDFRDVLGKEPKNMDALEGLAGLLMSTSRLDDAADILSQAVDVEPSADLYFQLGMVQAETNHLQEATESVREGIKLNPEYGNLYLLRAYIHQQRYQTAERDADIRTGIGKGGDISLFSNLLRP